MEILEATKIIQWPWWQHVALVMIAIGIFLIILGAHAEEQLTTGIGICFLIISVIIMVSTPWTIPVGYKYIVEITDNTKYEELINAGYDFERIYDTKTIYKIIGDELQ